MADRSIAVEVKAGAFPLEQVEHLLGDAAYQSQEMEDLDRAAVLGVTVGGTAEHIDVHRLAAFRAAIGGTQHVERRDRQRRARLVVLIRVVFLLRTSAMA